MTAKERILEELRLSGHPLDDDELARRLGISPRQTVNQACRQLETAGLLRRYMGSAGKIVNDLVRPEGSLPPEAAQDAPAASVVAVTPAASAPGDSREQRQAERLMLELLGEKLGVSLRPRRFVFEGGIRVEIDGADDAGTVLVEAWAHQGSPKSAQKNKVLSDTLKLLYVARTLPTSPRLVLCLSDTKAATHFTTARSWAALALREFGLEVHVVTLPDNVRTKLIEAQKRQFR